MIQGAGSPADDGQLQISLVYHFCRTQLPAVALTQVQCERHLKRTFELHRAKVETGASWPKYLQSLYPLDWFMASACLENDRQAWKYLFAARANRADFLLVDALRAARSAFTRGTRSDRRRPSRNSGAISWCPIVPHRRPFWLATTGFVRSCRG